MNMRYAEKRTRSANEPVIKAGVMIANLSWNIEKTSKGTVSLSAASPVPRVTVPSLTLSNMKKESGLPINPQPPTSWPNASPKPTKTQTRLITPSAITLCSMVETTFLKLTMPP